MNNNAIILLSGGLDSLVSTAIAKEKYTVKKALHFNYAQKPEQKELEACRKICDFYDIELKIINIDWLGNISHKSALNKTNSASSDVGTDYWIPNRNGLFVNIGACFAEALECDYVIIGANFEEAQGFKDNTNEFIAASTNLFAHSTQNSVKLEAPLISMNKAEIIKKAIELNAPLHLVWSCYTNGTKHCGTCPSCKLLKQALIDNEKNDLQKLLF